MVNQVYLPHFEHVPIILGIPPIPTRPLWEHSQNVSPDLATAFS
jgi:hypothetical protein